MTSDCGTIYVPSPACERPETTTTTTVQPLLTPTMAETGADLAPTLYAASLVVIVGVAVIGIARRCAR